MKRNDLMTYAIVAGFLCLGVLTMAGAGAIGAADNPVVVIETNKGNITVELDEAKAPITVENFLRYTDAEHYSDTIFHRVIPNFMIQGGGMSADNQEKRTRGGIKNEAGNGLKNLRGTIAMARTSDPDSATAQFFVNLKNNDFLDRANAQDGVGYTVFGKVIDGMDTVDKIAAVATVRNRVSEGYPTEPIVIKSIKRKDAQAKPAAK